MSDSAREILAREFDSHVEAPVDAPAPVESAPAEAPTEEPNADSGRVRDASGRFAPKEKVLDQTPTETPDTVPPSIEAPQSWPADRRAEFAQLPRATQEYLLQRDKETYSKITQLGDEKARIAREKQILEAVFDEPSPRNEALTRRQEWQLKGLTPDTAMRQFIQAQDFLEGSPVEGIRWLMNSLGVHPSQLMQQAQPQGDPRLQELSQTVQELKSAQEQSQMAMQQAHLGQLEHAVNAFASETDASGNLKRPHFAEVKDRLEPFIVMARQNNPQGNLFDVLEDAYQAAAMSVPSIRSQMQSAQSQALEEANKQVAARAAAQKARIASSSTTGSPSPGLTANAPTTVRGILEAAFDGRL